jgi:hypothetical protein
MAMARAGDPDGAMNLGTTSSLSTGKLAAIQLLAE